MPTASGRFFAAEPGKKEPAPICREPKACAATLGGLLKFVTKAPSTDGFDDKFQFGGDDLSHGGSGWSAKAMVNVPISDNAALRVSAYHTTQGGFIDDPGRALNVIRIDGVAEPVRVAVPILYHDPAAELLVLILAESHRQGRFAPLSVLRVEGITEGL